MVCDIVPVRGSFVGEGIILTIYAKIHANSKRSMTYKPRYFYNTQHTTMSRFARRTMVLEINIYLSVEKGFYGNHKQHAFV